MNLEAVRDYQFPVLQCRYTAKDTCLYALSVGAGESPLDAKALRFVYEKQLQALPTMASVLGTPEPWIRNAEIGINYRKLLHGEQSLSIHRALPAEGLVEAHHRVLAVEDRGDQIGAVLHFERQIFDAESGVLLCTVTAALVLRGDGGCGSFGAMPPSARAAPSNLLSTPPDFVDAVQTSERAALLYRLNGDLNPLHVDPEAAQTAGFDRPILHGLCTYGMAGYRIVRGLCDHDASRLRSLQVRFKSPVYAGETLQIEGWRVSGGLHFQATVPARQKVVLSHGYAGLE